MALPRLASVILLATLGLVACQTMRQEAANLLACENGEVVEVTYDGEWALVRYKNRLHRLQTAISGSGARYVGDGLQWWTKGLDEGTIASLKPGETHATDDLVACRAWPPR